MFSGPDLITTFGDAADLHLEEADVGNVADSGAGTKALVLGDYELVDFALAEGAGRDVFQVHPSLVLAHGEDVYKVTFDVPLGSIAKLSHFSALQKGIRR